MIPETERLFLREMRPEIGCHIRADLLHRLYVKTERKHCGIGTALLKALETEMKEKGITVSKVHSGDPAQYFGPDSFYLKQAAHRPVRSRI